MLPRFSRRVIRKRFLTIQATIIWRRIGHIGFRNIIEVIVHGSDSTREERISQEPLDLHLIQSQSFAGFKLWHSIWRVLRDSNARSPSPSGSQRPGRKDQTR